ncbi:MAG: hypothetical protein HZC41_08545 [Chloroflexi bacterium]|nr:hypothetical protein [Chloroflexota bacterium]
MASTKLAIHIPPDANPVNITEMVVAIARQGADTVFESVRDLLEYTESQGIGSRTEMQSTAVYLGLLEKSSSGLGLTRTGFALAKIREDVRSDLLHYLMYTGWEESDPVNFLPSWSYRICCDRYWEGQEVTLDSDYLNRQVEETINQAREAFAQLNIGEVAEVSFSRKSLEGAHKWLGALQPPVIENKVFTRRSFCPPELLLLAIGYVMKDETDATDIDILLTREKRDRICKVCLLDHNALDRALDWMLPIFPAVISPGTSAGFYGRFVRLHKLPTLEDVVR